MRRLVYSLVAAISFAFVGCTLQEPIGPIQAAREGGMVSEGGMLVASAEATAVTTPQPRPSREDVELRQGGGRRRRRRRRKGGANAAEPAPQKRDEKGKRDGRGGRDNRGGRAKLRVTNRPRGRRPAATDRERVLER